MRKARTTSSLRGEPGRFARGFTIIEATIVIGIIALLAGILLLAIGKVRRKGDVAAEHALVTTLQKAVEDFKQKYGFLPPLVVDNPFGGPIPVDTATGAIRVWSPTELADPNTTLNGSTPTDRRCFSNYSLAYYLVGALDKKSDGIDGLGFTAPDAGGQFTKHGRKFDPLVDLTQQKTRTGLARLSIEGLGTGMTGPRCVILDRWSDQGTPYPIRYYRWKPEYYPVGDPKAGQIHYWNIPVEIGGNPVNTLPPLNSDLRTAEYAIVSPGPDHDFLTIDDNIMEVGR